MVKWKGIDLKSKGIIVEKIPEIAKGKKSIDIYTIPGRSGFLSVDNGTYEQFTLSLECHFNDNKTSLDDVKDFLDGFGTLSLEDGRQYTAIINNSISFSKVVNFRKFIIQFLVNPISEDIDETIFEVTENTTLTITGATANMYPIIEIIGTGDVSITINNKTFYLKGISGECILDCKNKIITSNNINISDKMLYDFPFLKPNSNTIEFTGSVSSFLIKYKKSYL